MTTTQAIDQQKAEAFAGQMVNILNGSCLGLMTSVGHRTGLFNKMATMPPATSEQIAEAAGLNERYVREWLSAMAAGGIVEYDPAGRTFRLPPEHAASLTEAAGPANMATMMQFFALVGQTEDDLVECFRKGGGVPYSRFTKFQQLMAEESAQVVDATLVQTTLPLTGMVARLESGIDVLDVGCGKGHAINVMAKTYPNSRFTGYDFSEEGVSAGTAEAREMGLPNARFVQKDVATIEERAAYDLITAFDSIHDQAQPRKVLQGISDALRPGGVFLMVDIAASSHLHENLEHPLAPMLYSISTMHCMTVSLALDGEGLGTVWGEQLARELLKDAGFTAIDVKSVEGDFMNAYYICTKG
ncbi:MAG TPA: class I SAM-dependent methyltransferase [Dehalococcoidia bacterium]|nr:class I SAM-dependent methyltransferase [Dehalococcoidia bacterium]